MDGPYVDKILPIIDRLPTPDDICIGIPLIMKYVLENPCNIFTYPVLST